MTTEGVTVYTVYLHVNIYRQNTPGIHQTRIRIHSAHRPLSTEFTNRPSHPLRFWTHSSSSAYPLHSQPITERCPCIRDARVPALPIVGPPAIRCRTRVQPGSATRTRMKKNRNRIELLETFDSISIIDIESKSNRIIDYRNITSDELLSTSLFIAGARTRSALRSICFAGPH
jgi:hypothetical protein